jgi:alkanesulfonate monooxygenase SsuD/methylene tetrahydromethanopterin reductase-like flavin-dependent oxidoreductase (luciferase family)
MATQVLLLPLLNAADVAYNVATLDHIGEGRLDLGIGLAYHHRESVPHTSVLDDSKCS